MTKHLGTTTQYSLHPAVAQPNRPTLVPYMPHLDGLRALAVGAVLLYHADVPWLPGGFLGVDLFFVLSGYLITALLLAEWQTHETLNLARFWLRRARRLLPALFAVIAATLTFALIWLPDEVARLRGDALAALLYGTNWYQIFKHESYFETIGRPSLFQHLWSLAIEEQFYLLWPPLVLVLVRRWGRTGVLFMALVGVACSAGLMAWLYQPDIDPSRVYYGTDTRVLAPLLGAALACISPRSFKTMRVGRISALIADVIALAALAGLAMAASQIDEYQPILYEGGFVLVALLAAVMIAALAHPAALLSRRMLSSPLLRWLGTRSYAIYLWHWPIFMVTRPELDLSLTGWPLFALRLGITLLLSEITYRFVELPFRYGALEQAWHGFRTARGVRRWRLGVQWVASAILAIGVAALLGVAVVEARPPTPSPDQQIDAVLDGPLQTGSADESNVLDTVSVSVVNRQPSSTPVARESSASSNDDAFNPVDELRRERGQLNQPATQEPAQETPIPTITATAFAVLPPVPAEAPPAVPPAPAVPAAQIVAIGDSVMVGTARQIQDILGDLTIDAAVSRQAKAAIAIIRARRDAGKLGDVVIVHIGTNGPFSVRQFDEMMSLLVDVHRVVFVTVKVPRRWEGPNNTVIKEGVARYPNTVLADWHAASAGHPELFTRDGVHPQRAGARLFARVIAAAVNMP